MKRSFLFVSTLALLSGCHYEAVDPAPAVAVAKGFFAALEAGDPGASLGYFTPEFAAMDQWPRLLKGLNDRYGPVRSADIQNSSLSSDGKSPCYVLTYLVKRDALTQDDVLLVCRDADASHWSIRGHRLTRRDTQQSISGGVLPTEVGIKIP